MRGILLFCDKIPNKKQRTQQRFLAWKNSLELMANEEINKLISASMEKGLIKNEKELSMTFMRDKIVGKICSVTHFYWRMVMGKKNSSIPLFDWLNRYRNTYAYIYIKRIRGTEMKCSWMPKFDGQNQDNIHMHTYIVR